MKINNSLDVAKWEKLQCKCNIKKEIESYPFVKCQHCKCQQCWNSVPKQDFEIIDTDKDNNKTKRIVKEITLVRGADLDDVMGWIF